MAQDMWTVQRCLDWTRGYLADKGDEKARLAAEWLLGAACGFSRIELYMNFDRPLAQDELDRMHKMVVRRAKGEPLQYIAGKTGFRFIEVECAPKVLIPRPETEILVDEVLAYLDAECPGCKGAAEKRAPLGGAEPAADKPAAAGEGVAARVLEVGCGTGCVSLSIASERPGALVVATDIEPAAVELACRNRDALDLADRVDVREGDLVSPVRQEELGRFDVLVSNPPYIPSDVMRELPAEVADFEPALALDGGADGLDVFRRLIAAVPEVLRPGGLLACELHETALEAAADLCREAGFEQVRVVEDLAHRPRLVLARMP